MEWIKLLGIVIVIVGFALKMDAILIILVAAITTAFTGGLGVQGLLETLGTSFVNNRNMAIFILIMLVTGTLERNGLKEAAASLMKKMKGASSGMVIGAYGVMRSVFGAFNVSFGGVAGFVRPIIMPMATSAIEASGKEPKEEHVEELKGMASGMENIAWFFCQVLFVGGSGGLLVQSTLDSLGYEVSLLDLAKAEIPVAVFCVTVAIIFYYFKDKKLRKKYYGDKK
jgi:Predicted membrane protein